jgi:diguanylate cyclase (GGDEF)-like protein/PAS domain S-box-containing protein
MDTKVLGATPSSGVNTWPHAWRWFLAVEAVFALVYFPFGVTPGKPLIFGFLPWMEWPGQVPSWALLGLSAVAAIVLGIRHHRPNAPNAWRFLAAGVLLFITGDTTYKFWHQIIGGQIPFPSFVDAIYISVYPMLAIGLLLLARGRIRGGDRSSLIDALTITLGVGLLSWIFLIGPNVRGSGAVLVRLTAAAYPLGDVLLVAMLAHLWSRGGFRHAAGRLLAIGSVGILISDSLYGLANLHPADNWNDGNLIDLGWILFYACWGAAALHPSMRALSEPKRLTTRQISTPRLMALATVSLIGPVVLLTEAETGNAVDAPVIAVVTGLMFLLVLSRMAGLVRAHRQSVTREQVLRTSAAELVSAAGREGIYAATISGVTALVSGHSDIKGFNLVVASGTGELVVVGESDPPPNLENPDETSSERLTFSLDFRGKSQGFITIVAGTGASIELKNSVELLAAQVDLALDREVMTEIIHKRRGEERFQTLVQNASDVILIVRPDTTITYQPPSALKILGYAPGTLDGRKFADLIHPDDVEQALAGYTVALRSGTSVTSLWRVKHFDGSWRHLEVITTNLLSDLTVEGMVLTMRDVSERIGLEEELKHQAFHDSLTGLANRPLFHDRLEHALLRANRSATPLAILFIDLDDFKLVNDSLGHSAGDELLVAVAKKISGSLRSSDTAARFGGDEFAVLLEQTTNSLEVFEVADRITTELTVPVEIQGHQITARASIGIVFTQAGVVEGPADLMQAADVAMYAAKTNGKGHYQVYEPAFQSAIMDRLERTADLQRATDFREFELYYQPIVRLADGGLVGHEALVRWNHPQRGLLLPGDFIPLAEETGLIVPLGRWVLREACRQTRLWQIQHDTARTTRVSVNVSAKQFQHVDLVADVTSALHDAGLAPQSLVLEMTESILVENVDAIIVRMGELKQVGVSLAIDDFGTGYSSLSYLKDFPVDILKLDKSFVDDLGGPTENGALAESIIMLANKLHLQTTAEGIETKGQLDALRSFGCQLGQGFYFSKPLPTSKVDGSLSEIDQRMPSSASLTPASVGDVIGE